MLLRVWRFVRACNYIVPASAYICMQIYAVSDIHTDYKENLSWCVCQ